jgi:hypothetical protein
MTTYPHVYLSDHAGLTTKLAIAWDGQQWTQTEVALGRPLPDGYIWAPHPDHPDAARVLGQARQQAEQAREAALEDRFAELNPEFGVLPSRADPDQQRFAQGRERALALGTRVHLAEARENGGDDQAEAVVRARAERATRPLQRSAAQRAMGVER